MADEATRARLNGTAQKFNAVMGLTHVCGEVIFGRIMLVAGGFGAAVTFALRGMEMDEEVTFEMTRTFKGLVTTVEITAEFAFERVRVGVWRGWIVVVVKMEIRIVKKW